MKATILLAPQSTDRTEKETTALKTNYGVVNRHS